MKIHFLPPPLPLPLPAPPQKAPPTPFEIDQATQELIEASQQQRSRRIKLRKAQQDAKSERSERRKLPSETEDDMDTNPDGRKMDIIA